MNDKLKQLKAACQLAEMEHNADPEHPVKKGKFEKAQADFEQALAEEPAADGQTDVKSELDTLVAIIDELDTKNQELAGKNEEQFNEIALLNEQLNEKSQKLEEALKSAASAETALEKALKAAATPKAGAAKPAAAQPAETPTATAPVADEKKISKQRPAR
ncbi:hypothetical protein [Spirosoma litoris]